MGFKIAILLIPGGGQNLPEVIKSVYGRNARLEMCDQTVETALYPEDQKKAYACEEGGNCWIFDWALVPFAIDGKKPLHPEATLFYLHSVTNGYGFMFVRNNQVTRRRFGGSDEGIQYEDGDLSHFEMKAVTDIARDGEIEKVHAAWLDANKTVDIAGEDFSHDSFGEEVVFSILHSLSGIHLSMINDRSDAFLEMPVLEIKKANIISRIFN